MVLETMQSWLPQVFKVRLCGGRGVRIRFERSGKDEVLGSGGLCLRCMEIARRKAPGLLAVAPFCWCREDRELTEKKGGNHLLQLVLTWGEGIQGV